MTDNVRNKTALVTGGASGLGYKYAEILLRNGARRVAIVDLPTSDGRNAADALENAFGKERAVFLACDVTRSDDFEKTFKKILDMFQGLDILINNAGMLDDIRLEHTVELNLTALMRISLLALDHMGKHKGGKGGVIVNVASILGLSTVHNMLAIYSATKHGVVGFSKTLANFYDNTGVRVVIMCPGVTFTAIIQNLEEKVLDVAVRNLRDDSSKFPIQTTDNVALALVGLIQKGKNGEAWVSEGGQPPYAVDFVHYSERPVPV